MATPLAGATILASDIPARRVIVKAANESRTSTTTYASDADFSVSLSAGIWDIQLFLAITGAAAADFKGIWAFTGVGTILRTCIGQGASNANAANSGSLLAQSLSYITGAVYGVDGSNTTGAFEDLYVNVTTAGTLTYQWAQFSSSATATVLSASSRMYYQPMTV